MLAPNTIHLRYTSTCLWTYRNVLDSVFIWFHFLLKSKCILKLRLYVWVYERGNRHFVNENKIKKML